jgi:DNA-binding GntR family transcriptional regulator
VTGHAAELAKEGDIHVLYDILNESKSIIDQDEPDWDRFIDIDNNFHMELARIAGNHLYILVLKSIHDNINRYYNRFLSRDEKILREGYQDMCEIVKTIEANDAANAKLLAQDHVRRFNRFMELAEKESKGRLE